MKITLCGSIAFYDEMLALKKQLEAKEHEVKLPPAEIEGKDGTMVAVGEYYKERKEAIATGRTKENDPWIWERKQWAIQHHNEKIVWADAVLVANYDKKGVPGYIGGNTLMEMGIAFFLKKKIYLLNQIPELSYKEEIIGVNPEILNGAVEKV